MKPIERQFYSVPEVAEILGVCPDTIRALIASRRIASLKIGRHFKIRRAALDEYVARFERRAIEAGPQVVKRRKAA